MTEHEKRASDVVKLISRELGSPDDAECPIIMRHFTQALQDAHAAGFEAGLKARLPSEEQWARAFDKEFGDPNKEVTGWQVFYFCQKWLAANMRKGDV